jgi:hypothetical protein
MWASAARVRGPRSDVSPCNARPKKSPHAAGLTLARCKREGCRRGIDNRMVRGQWRALCRTASTHARTLPTRPTARHGNGFGRCGVTPRHGAQAPLPVSWVLCRFFQFQWRPLPMTVNFPRTLAAGLLGVATLAGCSGYGQPAASSGPAAPSTTVPSSSAPAPVAECNAQPAQFAVGQNSTAAVMESARVRSGAHIARILRPGQMVTKEFNAQRLNLEVDGNGRIVSVRCG